MEYIWSLKLVAERWKWIEALNNAHSRTVVKNSLVLWLFIIVRVNFDKLLKMYLRKKKDKMNLSAPCFIHKKLFSQFPIQHLYNNKQSENKVAFLQLKLKTEKKWKNEQSPIIVNSSTKISSTSWNWILHHDHL